MRKTWLLCCCLWLLAGMTYAQPPDCSSNGGPNIVVCYTEGSFQLLGEPATGNPSPTPNYTWTGPAGFNFSPSNQVLQPTVTQTGGLQPGTYTFTLCTDCNNGGVSCNPITVTIGDDPVDPTSITVTYTGCNEATVTVVSPVLNPGDAGQWTWAPFDDELNLTSNNSNTSGGTTTTTATFSLDPNDCGPYDVSYTIVNGGCESNTVTQTVNIDNIPPAWAGNDRSYCSTTPVTFTHCGNFPGCNGTTIQWTQIAGPANPPASPNSQCSSWTLPVPPGAGNSETYIYQYTLTPPAGSPCPVTSDQVSFTIINTPGVGFGPDEHFYFCGDFPASFPNPFCVTAGAPGYNWAASATVTLNPVPGQPECQDVFLPQGPNAPTSVWVRVVNPGGPNGECGDTKFFRFYRLDDVNVTADNVGIGCVPPGIYQIDLRDYIIGYVPTQTVDITINSAPGNSGIPTPSNTWWLVNLDVEGCYEFTISVSNVDAQTGIACTETVDLTVCRYTDVEQPNAGEPQFICAESTTLNGNTPQQAGTTITWTELASNPNPVTITTPDQTDPVVSGFDLTMNGAVYGFVYTFSLDNDVMPCEKSDTVYVTIDCPEECDSLYLGSCCEVIIEETGDTSNISEDNKKAAMEYLNGGASFRGGSGGPFPEDCDPCIDGGYPVWVEGPDGTPIDANDSDPCITIDWYDDQGNLIYSGWAFWADVNEEYTVVVTNICDSCMWERTFIYRCCEDIDVEIHNCCVMGGGSQQVSSGTQTYITKMYDDYNEANRTSLSEGSSCDPCENPEVPFLIGVYDMNANPITFVATPPYIITWTASDPSVLVGQPTNGPAIFAYVNVTYYVEVIDSAGCVHRDTFEINCCEAPANPDCRLDRQGYSVLSWDPVAGATGYQLQITINDPNCCERPSSPPYSLALINLPAGTTTYTPQVSYICASWSVRAICDSTHYSDFTASQCICTNRHEPQDPVKRTGLDTKDYFETFPSPASSFLTVQGEALTDGARIDLVDVSGRVVYSHEIKAEGKHTINTADMPNGIYFIRLNGADNSTFTQKVVIQH
ncbi:MAG: T9SS type A sorting domain-containing protein [Bacteroidia bacterium]